MLFCIFYTHTQQWKIFVRFFKFLLDYASNWAWKDASNSFLDRKNKGLQTLHLKVPSNECNLSFYTHTQQV